MRKKMVGHPVGNTRRESVLKWTIKKRYMTVIDSTGSEYRSFAGCFEHRVPGKAANLNSCATVRLRSSIF